jgi:formate hydrogenlyase subunit 3/multisubunit Na+/H+ antiporter MnhD subunit
MGLFPLAALPALVIVFYPPTAMDMPWFLVGIRLATDDFSNGLLLLAGLLWTAAGFYTKGYLADDQHLSRFGFFYLFTLSGNMGVIVAADLVSFYFFYTLMTFAAYGLIVHTGNNEAFRAGRIYLTMAIAGEVLLLVTVLISAAQFGNTDLTALLPALAEAENRHLLMGLAFAAFAIKAGIIPLHVWLPLAHPCAPTPASAVLSGIIIKTGFIGWLKFLPFGQVALPGWAGLFFLFGLLSTFFGVLVGLFQNRPKTLLAYSSISQMGLLTVLLSLGFQMPGQWDFILHVVLLFTVHHGLAKAGLFLGFGVMDRAPAWRYYGLLVLPAISLVGAPLTSGALAKTAFEISLQPTSDQWATVLYPFLTASSIATGLLMIRFLYLTAPRQTPSKAVPLSQWLSCLSLLIVSMTLPWWWGVNFVEIVNSSDLLKPTKLITGLLPMGIAGMLAATVWGVWRLLGRPSMLVLPEGDILALFPSSRWWRSQQSPIVLATAAPETTRPLLKQAPGKKWQQFFFQTEHYAPDWMGLLFLGLIAGLVLLFWIV